MTKKKDKVRPVKYDDQGRELFDLKGCPCWQSGIGMGDVSNKNTSGILVAKIIT